MKITIDVSQPLMATERAVLAMLLDHSPAESRDARDHSPAESRDARDHSPAESRDARDHSPAESRDARDHSPAESREVGGKNSVEEAVDLARSLIRGGDAASVTALLAAVGAERVSAMTTEQAEQFLAEARK